MPYARSARPVRPLDPPTLEALALHYVGRYATTEAKLSRYLGRKLRERGWEGDTPPTVDAIVAKLARLGYVDDAGFAEARAGALARRGYGFRRVAQSLHAAGVAHNITEALVPPRESAFDAAESYARRRRFGRFGTEPASPEMRRKQFAAMMRAGHDYDLARHFTSVSNDDSEGQET